MTKQKHDEILQFCIDLICGADARSLFLAGNKQAYKWAAKYDAILHDPEQPSTVESAILVLRPKDSAVDAQSLQLDHLQQPTYVERVFSLPWRRGPRRLTILSLVKSAKCLPIAAQSASVH